MSDNLDLSGSISFDGDDALKVLQNVVNALEALGESIVGLGTDTSEFDATLDAAARSVETLSQSLREGEEAQKGFAAGAGEGRESLDDFIQVMTSFEANMQKVVGKLTEADAAFRNPKLSEWIQEFGQLSATELALNPEAILAAEEALKTLQATVKQNVTEAKRAAEEEARFNERIEDGTRRLENFIEAYRRMQQAVADTGSPNKLADIDSADIQEYMEALHQSGTKASLVLQDMTDKYRTMAKEALKSGQTLARDEETRAANLEKLTHIIEDYDRKRSKSGGHFIAPPVDEASFNQAIEAIVSGTDKGTRALQVMRSTTAENLAVTKEVNREYAREEEKKALGAERSRDRLIKIAEQTKQITLKAQEGFHTQKLVPISEDDIKRIQDAYRQSYEAGKKAEEELTKTHIRQNESAKRHNDEALSEQRRFLREVEKLREQATRTRDEAQSLGVKAPTDTDFKQLIDTYRQDAEAGKAALRELDRTYTEGLRSARLAAKAEEQRYESLIRTRYALYDVARAYTMLSAATLGSVTATGIMAGKVESAFVNVERTALVSGQAAKDLRQDLMELSTEIPKTFTEVTEAATLGAQMGIAEDELREFSDAVLKTAATTTASIDEVATMFGRMGNMANLSSSEFERLASTIGYVGVNSVATESEINQMANSITAVMSQAGFAAHEIVGFSGALSSLGIPAERARGAVLRIITEINRAVAEGGEKLAEWSKLTGLAASELETLWKNDPATALRRIVDGFSDAAEEVGGLTTAFDALGLKNVRDQDVLGRLAVGANTFTEAMNDANKAWAENTFITEAFDKVADTTESKLIMLKNQLVELAATVLDSPLWEWFKRAIEVATKFLDVLTKLANTNAGKAFMQISGVLMTVVGVFAAFKAAVATTHASLMAMITGLRNMSKLQQYGMDTTRGLANTFMDLAFKSRSATAEVNRNTVALNQNAQAALASASAHSSALASRGNLVSVSGAAGASEGLQQASKAGMAFSRVLSGVGIAGAAVGTALAFLPDIMKLFETTSDKIEQAVASLGDFQDVLRAVEADTEAGDNSIGSFTVTLGEVSEEAKRAAQEQETLANVWGIDIPEGAEEAVEAIEEVTKALGEATLEAVRNKVLGSELVKNMMEDGELPELARKLGINFADMLEAGLQAGAAGKDPMEGINSVILEGKEKLNQKIEALEAEQQEKFAYREDSKLTTQENTFAKIAHMNEVAKNAEAQNLAENIANLKLQEEELDKLARFMGRTVEETYKSVEAGEAWISQGERKEQQSKAQAAAAAEEEEALAAVTQEYKEMASALAEFAGISLNTNKIASDMTSLAESLYETGGALDAFSAEGRASIESLDAVMTAMAQNSEGNVRQLIDDYSILYANIVDNFGATSDAAIMVAQVLGTLAEQEFGINFNNQYAIESMIDTIEAAIATRNALAALLQETTAWQQSMIDSGHYSDAHNTYLEETRDNYKEVRQETAGYDNLLNQLRGNINRTTESNAGLSRSFTDGLNKAMEQAASGADKEARAHKGATKAKEDAKRATDELTQSYHDWYEAAQDMASLLKDIENRYWQAIKAQIAWYTAIDNARANSPAAQYKEMWLEQKEVTKGYKEEVKGLKKDLKDMPDTFRRLNWAVVDANWALKDAITSYDNLILRVKELKQEQADIDHQLDILDIQLEIATRYGDDERVADILREQEELQLKKQALENDVASTERDLIRARENIIRRQEDIIDAEKAVVQARKDELRIREELLEAEKNLADSEKRQEVLRDLKNGKKVKNPEKYGIDTKGGLDIKTEEGRKNFKMIEDIADAYMEQAVAARASGASEKEVQAILKEGRAVVNQWLDAFGATPEQRKAFNDFLTNIDEGVKEFKPDNVIIDVKLKAGALTKARQAISAWKKKKSTKNALKTNLSVGTPNKIKTPSYNSKGLKNIQNRFNGIAAAIERLNDAPNPKKNATVDLHLGGSGWSDAAHLYYERQGIKVTFKEEGGLVGAYNGPRHPFAKGTDTVPAMLTPGEYVVRKQAVQTVGLDYLDALNSGRLQDTYATMKSMSGGTAASAIAGGTLELSPVDRQLLQRLGERPVNVVLSGRKFTTTINDINASERSRGV